MRAQKPAEKRPRWFAGVDVLGALKEHFDLTIALGVTLVALACMVVPFLNATGVRTIIALIFVLFVPGYVLIAALFPRRSDIGNSERAALSFAFSIGLLALIGLGLGFTPLGISAPTVIVCSTALTFACAWISVRRRAIFTKADRYTVRYDAVRNAGEMLLPNVGASFDKKLTLITIASLVLSASVFAYLLVTPSGEHFTELYVLGPTGNAKDYPQEITLGQTKSVIVGVINKENRATSYQLTVSLNDSGNASTLDTERITLGNGQKWEQPLSLTPDKVGSNLKMEFTLYRESDLGTPYRQVYFWVNVTRV